MATAPGVADDEPPVVVAGKPRYNSAIVFQMCDNDQWSRDRQRWLDSKAVNKWSSCSADLL